ncbi:GNAT family N-acetyltransferase [Gracilimonas amylolytica]|uniref:GNAT family N-acetyltransferase n=1 Tax=Gracilimonas amylolytica TaxID=1749045 RepID=UPI000CD81C35|nr:GNAT family N-acetyltransferase [Gracilimonas amylolytica]
MDIMHQETDHKGEFFIEKEGERIAEMTYSKAGSDKIIIDHTEVFEVGRGKGYGKKLVKHGVQFARDNDLKVMPLCPFAKAIIMKDESLQDVL